MATVLRILFASLGLMAGSGFAAAAEPAGPARLISQADVVGIAVKQSLIAAAKAGNGPFDIATAEAIEKFYEQHGNLPVWVDAQGFNSKAKQVIAEIKRGGDWGLFPADYAVGDTGQGPLSNAKLAEAELAMTRAAVRYAHDAHVGRFEPQRISELIDLMSTPPNATAVLAGLTDASNPGAFLASFNPHHPEFERLRQKYLELRGNNSELASQRIPDGPRLRPGDSSADIPLIRARLRVFAPANGNPETYDEVLAVAVKDFEDKYGFRNDGVITSALRRVLNQAQQAQPAKGAQVEKLLANMERWRWLPEDLGGTYIFDNIPEYMTRVVKDGQVIHQARIVVGKPDTPTPIFSNSMKYVEFHPFWKLPDSIKVKEILPSIANSGSGAIARRGLKMSYQGKEVNPATVNFGTTDIRAYEIFQPPGPGNALGDVKFMFPNHYDVYMHDTPSKDLFADSVRAFSHGCMRVQNPQKFAEVVMGEANGWSNDRLKQQFADATNQQVPLDHPLPVHVTYFTVRAAADGQLTFIDDVYGHDRRVTFALAGKWNQVSKQLAPKSTIDPALMASIGSDRAYGSASVSSGTFADIFGNSSDAGAPSRKHGRRHRRSPSYYNGSGSGFVSSNSNRSNNGGGGGFFGSLFGF